MKYKFFPAAIALGALIDIVATFVIILVAMIVLMVTRVIPLKQFSDGTYLDNMFLMVFFIAVGSGCSFLGGYITGRKSAQDEGFNCLVMASFGLILGLVFFNSTPFWYAVISLVLHVPIIYLGGIVAKRGKKPAAT